VTLAGAAPGGNATLAQQLGQALDFSGLKGVFDVASSGAQTALFGGGWLADVRFCSWAGVQCDPATGRVSSV
jgi:hypothetical protein